MKTLLNSLLKKLYPKRRSPLSKSTSGFTMIELLVATIVATIIIVPILTFVVDILNRDVREQAKTNSEQELQAAVDYIAQDMSQAFYVYDDDGVTAIEEQLPYSDDNEKTPILVFWKREFVRDALEPSGGMCSSTNCDDTFVQSLVVYYLIEDDQEIWCQPSGSTCPKRIARFQIQDGVRDTQGNYVCGFDGLPDCDSAKFEKSQGFNSYDRDNPTNWTKDGDYNLNKNKLLTLLNYIEDLTLDNVSDSNNLAQITIIGNALRRSQNDFSCIEDASATPPYKDSPYCPKATAQVGARSGFGTSE
ncbi:MAG: type II secretion system protein [Okeania sp. SIO2F4]|uniref:hormogonium polysaccharide secretion pseudopilin HpsC n=1 Tax=Okeania sp. SIO2F4 TaxID=2607790 RepID=UPI00142C0D02|nr:hormogonium polysaccharide secretion pseudopilin HpsC [Okeania sp. SIO2F4]NES02313.1 type II secretion system protein [Okeania sp. SIO2F4]